MGWVSCRNRGIRNPTPGIQRYATGGNLRLLLNGDALQTMIVLIFKTWMERFFSKHLEKGQFSKYMDKIPLPSGAAEPRERRRKRHQAFLFMIWENM